MNNWISLVIVALCLSYVCTTFSMAVLPSMNTALTVAESGSEDVSIGLSYLVPQHPYPASMTPIRDCLQEFRHVCQHQHVNRVTGAVASSLFAFSPRSRECGPDSRDGGLSKGLIRSDCLAPWSVPMSVRLFLSAQPENTSTDGKFVCCRWDLRPLNLAIGS